MIKSEIYRILKSRKSLFFIILLLIIPNIDLVSNWRTVFADYFSHPKAYHYYFPVKYIMHPSAASFLSGNSIGHTAQELYIWVLPLYLLIIYCDSYIQDKRNGYNNIIFCKSSRKNTVYSKLLVSFIVPFFISFISSTINYILALILFHGGTSFNGLENYMSSKNGLLYISLMHPYVTYAIYIFMFSLISGACGIMCMGLSLLIPNYIFVYPLAFFIWFIQIIYTYSITYLTQPFIEYGFNYLIPSALIFFSIAFVIAATSFLYKVKYDEL